MCKFKANFITAERVQKILKSQSQGKHENYKILFPHYLDMNFSFQACFICNVNDTEK